MVRPFKQNWRGNLVLMVLYHFKLLNLNSKKNIINLKIKFAILKRIIQHFTHNTLAKLKANICKLT